LNVMIAVWPRFSTRISVIVAVVLKLDYEKKEGHIYILRSGGSNSTSLGLSRFSVLVSWWFNRHGKLHDTIFYVSR